jgi:hypothetical protein
MKNVNAAQLVSDAWDHMLRVNEDPFRAGGDIIAEMVFGQRRKTYRERLHRKIINSYGQEVPRIEIVRENIRKLYAYRREPLK